MLNSLFLSAIMACALHQWVFSMKTRVTVRCEDNSKCRIVQDGSVVCSVDAILVAGTIFYTFV